MGLWPTYSGSKGVGLFFSDLGQFWNRNGGPVATFSSACCMTSG